MDIGEFYNSDLFEWVILPLLIFCARLIDVSLGTLRIIFISRGLKYVAPLIAFVEINIWLLAIGQIITHIDNPICALAYAGGFSLGNFVGILIEEKVSIGNVLLRIITKHDPKQIVDCLKSQKYGVTTHDAEGMDGNKVKIIFAVVHRADLHKLLNDIEKIQPHAFYTVEDIRSVGEAVFPSSKKRLHNLFRKRK